ncbi:MAG: LytR C-terminal domain-containing protein [Candidatus Dojkabacteria bacterium]|nr:LytR C-terminal domain-containing protein [Candidatus Dojkabacteria bacterium]
MLDYFFMYSKFKVWFRKTRLGNWYFSRNRKTPKGKGQNNKQPLFNLNLLKYFKFSSKRNLVIVLSLFFTIFIGFNLFIYFSIEPKTIFSSKAEITEIYDEGEKNILLVGISSEGGYSYIDLIQVLTLDLIEESANLYSISPLTSSIDYTNLDSNIQLKSVFNNNLEQPELKVMDLRNNIETMLSLRIDRYVIFETADFVEYITADNQLYKDIGSTELANYYFNDHNTSVKEVNKRQLKLISDFIDDNSSSYNQYFNLFLKNKELTDLFRTDMTRNELISFVQSFKFISSNIRTYNLNLDEILVKEVYTPLELNQKYIFETIKEAEKETIIITEQAGIEVYNDTQIKGLANKIANRLEVKGAAILRPANYVMDDEDENILYVVGDEERYANTVDLIRRELRGNVIISEDEYKFNHTGDLILILAD